MKRAERILIPLGKALAVAAFWLAVWAFAARRVDLPLLLPSPGDVFRTLWKLLGTADFYRTAGRSLGNVALGILSAVACGTLLALLTYRLPPLRALLLPLMTVVKATPVASFIVLALIWIGSARVPAFITFLIVLPVVWTNLDEGLSKQDHELAEVAKVYRMSGVRRLRYLLLPTVRPYFLSACRTSLGLAWKAGIAAEIIARPPQTIGLNMSDARVYFSTEELFAWTLTVILLSLLIEFGLVALLRKLFRNRKEVMQ